MRPLQHVALDMQVVAEGVKNGAQVQISRNLGSDELQDYYISKPLPGTNVEAVFAYQG